MIVFANVMSFFIGFAAAVYFLYFKQKQKDKELKQLNKKAYPKAHYPTIKASKPCNN